jgi:hypothetical protein
MSAVTVINNDTDITPWDVGVHASRTTFIAGNSAIGAARKAKAKILAAAATKTGIAESELDLVGGFVVRAASGEAIVELAKFLRGLHFSDKAELVMTTFYYEPPSVHQDKGFKGDVSAAYAWATQVVEVEVDCDTGIVKMTKVTGAHDVGRVINRLGIEGQIEGGVMMGLGYALTEHLLIEDGRVRNPSFRDYKLVTAPEIPEMDLAFIETMDGEGPQGAKGVGEAPAICIAAATANAIYNATGVRIYELPFTPEKVYRALKGVAPKVAWRTRSEAHASSRRRRAAHCIRCANPETAPGPAAHAARPPARAERPRLPHPAPVPARGAPGRGRAPARGAARGPARRVAHPDPRGARAPGERRAGRRRRPRLRVARRELGRRRGHLRAALPARAGGDPPGRRDGAIRRPMRLGRRRGA